MSEFTQITLKSLQMSIPKLSRGFEQMPKMLMRICSNMHRHLYKKHVKHHEKIMQDLSQIGPKPFQNLLNSSLRSFWVVFGVFFAPRSAPRLSQALGGLLLLAPFGRKLSSKGPFLIFDFFFSILVLWPLVFMSVCVVVVCVYFFVGLQILWCGIL